MLEGIVPEIDHATELDCVPEERSGLDVDCAPEERTGLDLDSAPEDGAGLDVDSAPEDRTGLDVDSAPEDGAGLERATSQPPRVNTSHEETNRNLLDVDSAKPKTEMVRCGQCTRKKDKMV